MLANPDNIQLKAERREPSGKNQREIADILSLTGVLAHYR